MLFIILILRLKYLLVKITNLLLILYAADWFVNYCCACTARNNALLASAALSQDQK